SELLVRRAFRLAEPCDAFPHKGRRAIGVFRLGSVADFAESYASFDIVGRSRNKAMNVKIDTVSQTMLLAGHTTLSTTVAVAFTNRSLDFEESHWLPPFFGFGPGFLAEPAPVWG